MMLAPAGAATADPDAAPIWRKEPRRAQARHDHVRRRPGLDRPTTTDHSIETAADPLWLAMDTHNYAWLVHQRGWTAHLCVDTVAAPILTTQ
jgi:TetR/AcrR family transcriptional regulator of autoinduction and epiphytic fitness